MLAAIPPIAIGAVGAALIAAIVSLLGLIISKEQKTSEFRQAWIDGLRSDLTIYLAELNAICDASAAEYETHAELIEALGEKYSRLNNSNFAIILRINELEDKSRELLKCMDEFNQIALEDNMTAANLRPIETRFLAASRKILKSEWRRVKSGEATFRIAKYVSLSFAGLLTILALYAAITQGNGPMNPRSQSDTNVARPK